MSSRRGFLASIVTMLVGSAGLLTAAQAQETCGGASTGLCFDHFSAITAAAPTASGYAAIATIRDQLSLLRLSAGGQISGQTRLDRPDWLDADAAAPTINALASRPDGSVLAVGWATEQTSDELRQVGAVALISIDGKARWIDLVDLDDTSSIILHSAVYDALADRFMVVGRVTSGGDANGSCKEWAQAIAFSVPANPETSVARKSIARFGSTGKGPRNRIALLDVVAGRKAGEFVAVGFATEANEKKDGCQDDAIAMRIEEAKGSWRLGKPYVLIKSTEGEVASAVVSTGDGRYVFAGSGALAETKARATLTGSFGFADAKLTSQLVTFPNDRDTTGGDRYRALAALGPSGPLLAAGSASAGRDGSNQGIWTTLKADGTTTDDTRYLSRDGGSDILDLAVDRNGKVLAVGTYGVGDSRIGWLGILGEQRVASFKRRSPDTSLPLVDANALKVFSEADITSGTGIRHKGESAGGKFEMQIALSKEMDIAVSALASKGDVNLSLVGVDGRYIAQSGNAGDAGEYLSARLPAGEYRLAAVAASDLGEYEVRLSQQNLEDGIWSLLLELDVSARRALAASLEGAGYGAAANPAISLGADTVRAFLAYCLTFITTPDPTVVSQFVPKSTTDAVQ